MKILLLGEYSNVHCTLAQGLRKLGHDVTVASDGDSWKNYPRDIDLKRTDFGRFKSLAYILRLHKKFHKFKEFDIVQIINPVFLPLKAERIWSFYKYLRKHNNKIFMGAFGMDFYYAQACLDCHTFRYSDFNIGKTIRHTKETEVWKHDWINGEKARLNQYIAADCNGIIAGLYEYHTAYKKHWSQKLTFIPFPIIPPPSPHIVKETPMKIKFFIGIQRARSAYKGTDIMLRALERGTARCPNETEMIKVESVPVTRDRQLMDGCHIILDQLYAYTPAMNALEAMSKGLVVVGGGEPENYEIISETNLRPIINVIPTEESVYNALCDIIIHRNKLPQLSADSRTYIERHHDYLKVAQEYIDFWSASE